MITFSIKFLLAFSLHTKEKNKKIKPNSESNKKRPKTEIADPPNIFRLEKNDLYVHIEYQLYKLKPFQIDVLCWRNVVKIYSPENTKIFKTITRGNLVFAPICVEHTLKELSIEELLGLKDSVIEFKFFYEKSKLGNAARNNKTNVIFINESDIERHDVFIEVFDEEIKMVNVLKLTSSIRNIEVGQAKSAIELLKRNDELNYEENFAEKMYEIINYLSGVDKDIYFKDVVQTSIQKSATKAKQEKNLKNTFVLPMQGEIFFTDVDAIFHLEPLKGCLKHVFLMPSVENLLTRYQKIFLNPIIIKLNSSTIFPDEVLKNTGFTHIFCKYSIPSIAESRTIEKPLERTMRFMDSHIFPTYNLPKIKFLEFLETKRLLVEIYGILRYQGGNLNSKLFGQKSDDLKLSSIHFYGTRSCLYSDPSKKFCEVLLAYCSFNLSSLLQNIWDFKGKEQLHAADRYEMYQSGTPRDFAACKPSDISCNFWSFHDISMPTINMAHVTLNPQPKCYLKEYVLIENNSVLDLEAYLLSPQSAALVLHQIPNIFKRMLLITYDREFARQWCFNIVKHNEQFFYKDMKNNYDILTGFVIDNGSTFVFYIEGDSVGYILNLCRNFEGLKNGKVFFNSDQAYEDRLYPICNKWMGFYFINMKVPLQQIINKPKLYVKGNVPILCQKALIKLNLLFLSNTMKVMLQDDLFPNLEELISLDMEYGVPFSWQPFLGSINSSGI
ncbi:hypothetical protein ABEB36_004976 [Hypothenemus hampei]|uniref:DUF4550 domain-containing protein n=1 Tax=Hypothenemus hampei TaxID=57062 RepID=A0ABD1EZJ9_HYPHA